MGTQENYTLTVIVRGIGKQPIYALCPIECLMKTLWIYAVVMPDPQRTIIWRVKSPHEMKPKDCDARAKIEQVHGTVYVLLHHEQITETHKYFKDPSKIDRMVEELFMPMVRKHDDEVRDSQAKWKEIKPIQWKGATQPMNKLTNPAWIIRGTDE